MNRVRVAPACKDIYPNIEAERGRKHMTVEELTLKIGVKRRSYYQWLNRGHIPQKRLELMADVFECSIDYLLGKTELRNPDAREGA
jgi:transcriptional regulator with XRE-family HTH domain